MPQSNVEFLRTQWLAGFERRANRLTATAFRTGKNIQQIFPAEMFNAGRPEALAVFYIQKAHISTVKPFEKNRWQGRYNMKVLGKRQKWEKGQQSYKMQPPIKMKKFYGELRTGIAENTGKGYPDDRPIGIRFKRDGQPGH